MAIAITQADRIAEAQQIGLENVHIDGWKAAEHRQRCPACKARHTLTRRIEWAKKNIQSPRSTTGEPPLTQGKKEWLADSMDGLKTLEKNYAGLKAELDTIEAAKQKLKEQCETRGHGNTPQSEIDRIMPDAWGMTRQIDTETGEIIEGYKTAYTGWTGRYSPSTKREAANLARANESSFAAGAIERAARLKLEFAHRYEQKHMGWFLTLTMNRANEWLIQGQHSKDLSKALNDYLKKWRYNAERQCRLENVPPEQLDFKALSTIEYGAKSGRKHVHIIILGKTLPRSTSLVRSEAYIDNAKKLSSWAHRLPRGLAWPYGFAHLLPIKWHLADTRYHHISGLDYALWEKHIAGKPREQEKALGAPALADYVAGHTVKSTAHRRRAPNEKLNRPPRNLGGKVISEIAEELIQAFGNEPTNTIRQELENMPDVAQSRLPTKAILKEWHKQAQNRMTEEQQHRIAAQEKHYTGNTGERIRRLRGEPPPDDRNKINARIRAVLQTVLGKYTWLRMEILTEQQNIDPELKHQHDMLRDLKERIEPHYGTPKINNPRNAKRMEIIAADIVATAKELGLTPKTNEHTNPDRLETHGQWQCLHFLNCHTEKRGISTNDEQLRKIVTEAKAMLAPLANTAEKWIQLHGENLKKAGGIREHFYNNQVGVKK